MASAEDIRPGDVLLFRGRSFISWAIRFCDGSEVNHAAVAVRGGRLAEAAGSGLRLFDIGKAVAGNERTVVQRIKSGASPDPVVALAEDYVERELPYAYQQILLLAFLCLTRRLPIENPLLRKAVRVALDRAASLLNSLFDSGKELMICSEFVYRCFEEAAPGDADPYEIDLLGLVSGRGAPVGLAGRLPRSVHPASLASLVVEGGPVTPATAVRESPAEDSDAIVTEAEAELEPMLAEFAADCGVPGVSVETVAVGARGVPGEVTDHELLASARRFALALEPGLSRRRGVAAPKPDLLSVVADFVTPGDLLRSPSLFEPFSLS